MRKLPQAYQNRMKKLLGESFGSFLNTYDEAPRRGLRFNMQKARQETIEKLVSAWHLKPVPWCGAGYYYEENGTHAVRPGLSPYHDAGVFYIQEPSAMIPAECAQIQEGERVLDLCAAPGGKSTQAAQCAGLLISNEYIKKRAQILSSNIERMGFSNVIVTSSSAEALAETFPLYFDCVLVDAPCSGEGMMRRDEIAVSEWSEENVGLCAARQREILDFAFEMVRPGGRLVYSTCTFEPEENGRQTEAFLQRHEELRLFSEEQMYPHTAEGEGHYCAVFRRGQSEEVFRGMQQEKKLSNLQQGKKFGNLQQGKKLGNLQQEELLQSAAERLRKKRIPILRCGVEPGERIVGKHRGEERYEPSHAEALSLREEALSANSLDLLAEGAALSYLRGEALDLRQLPETSYRLRFEPNNSANRSAEAKQGKEMRLQGKCSSGKKRGQKTQQEAQKGIFIPVCYDGYPLGWGKLTGNTVKNHYPKGLRRH